MDKKVVLGVGVLGTLAFLMTIKPKPGNGVLTLFEHWETSDNADWVHSNYWIGQTFTPQETHIIKTMKFEMNRSWDGIVTQDYPIELHIRNVDPVTHLPIEGDLAAAFIPATNIPLYPERAKLEFVLDADVIATAGVELAAILYAPYTLYYYDDGSGNTIFADVIWVRISTVGGYPGYRLTSGEGITWVASAQRSYVFEEWGI